MDLAYAKMVADTQYGAGGLYFYEEYFEWRPKSGALMNLRFMIRYDELDDIKITPTRKSQVLLFPQSFVKKNFCFHFLRHTAWHVGS